MATNTNRQADRMVDDASEGSFPASDPPAHSGITGTGRPNFRGEHHLPSQQPEKNERPAGSPPNGRHQAQTAHQREHPGQKHPSP